MLFGSDCTKRWKGTRRSLKLAGSGGQQANAAISHWKTRIQTRAKSKTSNTALLAKVTGARAHRRFLVPKLTSGCRSGRARDKAALLPDRERFEPSFEVAQRKPVRTARSVSVSAGHCACRTAHGATHIGWCTLRDAQCTERIAHPTSTIAHPTSSIQHPRPTIQDRILWADTSLCCESRASSRHPALRTPR